MWKKRKGPKSTRAGCLLCKPWKINGEGKERKENNKASDFRRKEGAKEQIEEHETNGVVR